MRVETTYEVHELMTTDRLLLCLTLSRGLTNTLWTIPIWRVRSSSALCSEHSFCW